MEKQNLIILLKRLVNRSRIRIAPALTFRYNSASLRTRNLLECLNYGQKDPLAKSARGERPTF